MFSKVAAHSEKFAAMSSPPSSTESTPRLPQASAPNFKRTVDTAIRREMIFKELIEELSHKLNLASRRVSELEDENARLKEQVEVSRRIEADARADALTMTRRCETLSAKVGSLSHELRARNSISCATEKKLEEDITKLTREVRSLKTGFSGVRY